MDELRGRVQSALKAISCLVIYRHVFEDPVLKSYRLLLELVQQEDPGVAETYFSMIGRLIELDGCGHLPGIDVFENHFLEVLVGSENAFSLHAEQNPLKDCLLKSEPVVKNDLRLLKMVYDLGVGPFLPYLKDRLALNGLTPDLGSFRVNRAGRELFPGCYWERRRELKETLARSPDWAAELKALGAFYRVSGSGSFGRYWAFRWNGNGCRGELSGIANPDPVRLEDLVGCEDQKAEVVRNTRQFMMGFKANNILLYGDRGTGKSSTIKGLLHIFGRDGLRLLEVSKHDLLSLPGIIRAVEGRVQKFIIFIDDLSFDEDEKDYRELKALLEGSIEKPPVNVLIYATSNRRNLVREFFSDRDTDEVGRQDTYQEKLSMADRFGIKLVYPAPGKREYLQAVEAIASREGIPLELDELHELALRWVLWHNARSGRTARQFVDDLKGKLDLAE